MKTKLQGPFLPYILDLETGISFPRECALLACDANPVSRDAIRRRAYARWEEEGRPNDHGVANWLAAEIDLQSTPPVRVRAIPAVRLDPRPGESHLSAPSEVTDGAPVRVQAVPDGRSPLGREVAADDVRDYAFHLYVQSGCDQEQTAECWEEANRCLNARIPKSALAAA